jgi:hypothetical protein
MKKILAIAFLGLYILPAMASAAALSPYWGPLTSCVGAVDPAHPALGADGRPLEACKSFCDLLATGQNFIKFGMTIALYILAPILFIWGGVVFMTSRGSESQLSEAKKMLTSTIVGVAVVLSAFLIVNTFFYFFAKTLPKPTGPGVTPGFQEQITWDNIKCSSK